MRSRIIIALLFCSLLQGCVSRGPESANSSNAGPAKSEKLKEAEIRIVVGKGDWGGADLRDIEAVLRSTAAELLRHLPGKTLSVIVNRSDGPNPRTPYYNGPKGEYIVLLSATGREWERFAYQFSHELTHVLARDEATKTNQKHKWFEESLCAMASLFTLRRIAITWRTDAPHPDFKKHASVLQAYADRESGKKGRQLPANVTFAQWYKANESYLRNKSVSSDEARDKQFIVAQQLLPIFEKNPELWASIRYLNVRKAESRTLNEYLDNWEKSAPSKYKSPIKEVAELFIN